jgi:AcrR family transcriptional regulator
MDRRQRKTRAAIYAAFEELLLEERFARITTSQIIERSGIGRSTFYAHFPTKEALLDQMCQDLLDHVFGGVQLDLHDHGQAIGSSTEATLGHLLHHVHEDHHGICGKLLADNEPHATSYFCDRLGELLRDRLPERSSWVPESLMRELVVAGFRQAVAWWHESGYEAPAEDVAHWYARTLGWKTERRASA